MPLANQREDGPPAQPVPEQEPGEQRESRGRRDRAAQVVAPERRADHHDRDGEQPDRDPRAPL
jgi:hypothetical protein